MKHVIMHGIKEKLNQDIPEQYVNANVANISNTKIIDKL